MINAIWPDAERQKWEAHCQAENSEQCTAYIGTAPYTEEEKSWLKHHYGGEFRFLRLYNLNIGKEEDREEGRAIARTFMQADEEEMLNQ